MSISQAITIFTPERYLKLLASDLRKIVRDPTLTAVLVFSILPAILFYFFADWMNQAASDNLGLSNITFYLAPIFLVLPAYLIGWIIGFLILEERDEGPLLALTVTPVGLSGIALFRASLTFLLVIMIALASTFILLPNATLSVKSELALFTALQAVAITFALPAIANNKVQGLALTKVINLFSIVPLMAAIPSPWRYLAGLLPSFWVGEMLALSPMIFLSHPLIVTLGLITHVAFIWFFYSALMTKN